MKFSRLFRKALIAASMVGMATSFGGRSASAATETGTLAVSATVSASCLVSTAAVNFGNYDPLTTHATAPLDGAGSVIIRCADGLAVNVRLGLSAVAVTGSVDDAPLREMAGPGGDRLAYNLFTDPARTDVWGNTAATGVGATGDGLDQALPIYGQIPAGQNRASGVYNDTVTASVVF
jgi:spore coat protein U-like protein